MITFYGFNVPFFSTHASGGGNSVSTIMPKQFDERLVRNDLLQLLLTAPGERVMRPKFGSGIRPALFELATEQAVESLRSDIREAIETWEPRVEVTEIDIENRENTVYIGVHGNFKHTGESGTPDYNGRNLLVELNIPMDAALAKGAQ